MLVEQFLSAKKMQPNTVGYDVPLTTAARNLTAPGQRRGSRGE